MCIFSQHVEHVAQTKIFARSAGGEQLLAYEMAFSALGDLAMVLPVPILPGSGEQALRFVDLSQLPDFVRDLSRLFPEPVAMAAGGFSRSAPQAATLTVHQVGAFEASFVPTLADLARLDARFRLPAHVWAELPFYRDFGFAVFKLRGEKQGLLERLGLKSRHEPAPRRVHPMAFAFQSRAPADLFFPTVHVHDGRVHREARFDHELYCQLDTPPAPYGMWECATRNIARTISIERSAGLIDALSPCFRLRLSGVQPNQDAYARPSRPTPARRVDDPAALGFHVAWSFMAGPIADWDNVVRNVIERSLPRLHALHEQHVAGFAGWSTVSLEFSRDGSLANVIVRSDYESQELIHELGRALRAVRMPELEGGSAGRVEFRCGLGYVPMTPLPPGAPS